MKLNRALFFSAGFLLLGSIFASGATVAVSSPTAAQSTASPADLIPAAALKVASSDPEQPAAQEKLVNLDLRNVDIGDVLALFSKKYKFDIVAGKEVTGRVTISLSNAPVEEALRAILAVNGFGCIKSGNLIVVSTLKNLSQKDSQLMRDAMTTRVFTLNYISAEEVKRISDKFLSSIGTSEVVRNFSTGGWEMSGVSSSRGGGVTAMGEKTRKKSGPEENPKTLLVTDLANVIDKIAALIRQVDIKPTQILIDAMIVEIGSDYIRDIGIEWNLTQTHHAADVMYGFATLKPATEGLTVDYSRSHVTAKVMALEQAGNADILSNPRIMTLDNYPAVIMVGEKYPIMTTTLTSDPSGNGKVIATGALDHYEPIGIILRVIPHLNPAGVIELILHPEVTSLGDPVSSGTGDGALVLPRINSRETDTIVTTKDGQTVVIGGLLTKNIKQVVRKIPLLGDIPLLGYFFRRTVKESKKVELMIFITPQIINDPANADKLLKDKIALVK